MKLTQEEKQIKIAEACGAKWRKFLSGYTWITFDLNASGFEDSERPEDPSRIAISSSIPDYFNDLNACHDVWEKTIKGNDTLEDKYSIELLRAVGSKDPADGTRPNGSDATWALASNAPSQARFEAFGPTLNLWKTGE